MRVRDLVGGEVVWVEPTANLRQAAEMMISTGVGSVAVEVEGKLEGILTERDLVHAMVGEGDFGEELVEDWMTPYPDTFGPDMSVEEAANWMLATGYRHLPVVEENGSVLGVISIKDVLWAMTDPAEG